MPECFARFIFLAKVSNQNAIVHLNSVWKWMKGAG
jgi:hypothetical protein